MTHQSVETPKWSGFKRWFQHEDEKETKGRGEKKKKKKTRHSAETSAKVQAVWLEALRNRWPKQIGKKSGYFKGRSGEMPSYFFRCQTINRLQTNEHGEKTLLNFESNMISHQAMADDYSHQGWFNNHPEMFFNGWFLPAAVRRITEVNKYDANLGRESQEILVDLGSYEAPKVDSSDVIPSEFLGSPLCRPAGCWVIQEFEDPPGSDLDHNQQNGCFKRISPK